ncbi:MAG TPA: Gfo/Idh/MocA family oxidoreductase [Candidatus Sumerlaeota bacterium]|nr:Gfo/Idh/MocA family oxidoreductase [Candidatus Sumerlaeota bacterium]HOR27706.1 Gfo/Idh/MocA family oxidoreductase [Candidatus Sumerlaeota bacterium]HPK01987.1 Gfo/Idh/MocA family oxidoreductase [Candidatus Sumerlaeota bacterium]
MSRKIRMGMVGGGQGSAIGKVHRMAAALDGQLELVCGAFSSDPRRSKASCAELYLPADRVYDSYAEMFERERRRPEGDRMDFVVIVTPNHLHYAPAAAALKAGFHVMCDKPMTFSLAEARKLKTLVDRTGLLFGLTHNYTGYPMVKEARELARGGKLGAIRKIVVEYPQGWLHELIEATGQKQAAWRTDPARSGAAGCMGDIGTHAENLAEYITGLRIDSLCAELTTFVKGRKLDDDGNVLIRYQGGARGILHASQIAIDEENGLNIRVWGEKGGLQWRQEEPNTLILKRPDGPRQLIRSGQGYLSRRARRACRLPAGHPEGFIEAFANLYRNYAEALRARLAGRKPDPLALDFPTVDDGVRGMAFIEAVVKSARAGAKWVKMAE